MTADSLPARLVHQAARKIKEQYDKSVSTASLPVIHATTAEEWTPEAREAVVSVLDTLAEDIASGNFYGWWDLHTLAARVKEDGQGHG